MTKRKSFILHHDSLEVLNELSDEQAGKLFKAIYSYQKFEKHDLDGLMNAVFLSFKNQFDRDDEKYQKICERNRNNGLNGGRPKPKITQSVIYEPKRTQKNPKEPDNDSVSDNVNDSKNKKESLNKKNNTKKDLLEKPDDVSEEVWNDFIHHRKQKKALITKTVITRIKNEAAKVNWTLEDALSEIVTKNWQGFNSDWVKPKPRQNNDWTKDYDFTR